MDPWSVQGSSLFSSKGYETSVILFALKVASSRGMTMLVIFSDALEVVKAAKAIVKRWGFGDVGEVAGDGSFVDEDVKLRAVGGVVGKNAENGEEEAESGDVVEG
ncbi:hypothetical protein MRB53_020381 [Persea americana]|uniref:Uncharacterized protein n=1 Tax=Persea americana TaxID=3435 RepID=A0ACC2L211_PERAE|nr:hypothetical protein MRB53_020381 [Persea americana]